MDAAMTEPSRPGAVSEAETPGATRSPRCPSCAAMVNADEQYCEGCGAELGPVPTRERTGYLDEKRAEEAPAPEEASCHECGGDIAADGYCTECGAKARSPRDHFTEQPAAWVAAVCDRGIRHSRNEDAVALNA